MDQHERKRKVLKQSQASRVRSISEAIVIKDGDPFFLCRPDGQIPTDGEHGFGLYQHDTRFLEGYEVEMLGIVPEPLAATAAAGRTAILELTNPEIDLGGDRTIGKDRLAVRWTRDLDGTRSTLTDTFDIHNHDTDAVDLQMRMRLAAGFRDVFEIRGLLKEPPGERHEPAWESGRLVFRYEGRDGVSRTLTVAFEPGPSVREGATATCDLHVPGRGEARLRLTFTMDEAVPEDAPAIPSDRTAPVRDRQPGQIAGHLSDGPPVGGGSWGISLSSDSPAFDAVMRRSLADLDLLRTRLDDHAYVGAGLPWFSALFGRDSLIVALQTLAYDPDIALGTLRLLAGRQGTREDPWRDEEPGRILHELRVGELARLGQIPQTPYYGTVDATPLFLIVLAAHADWTGSLALFDELRPNVDRALDWIDRREAASEHGFLAYASSSEGGLANQGWKDSGDGIVDEQGRIARPPIALAEVQGYVYAARLAIADLYERSGDRERVSGSRAAAERLRRRFEGDFWSDELGCYVMALQGDRSPCSVVSSNAGQVLFSGIASPDRARSVQDRMLAEDMFSGWGIRTLSTDAVAYNPVGYHLGTVWPHDNSLIAAGFRRYGGDSAVVRIMDSLIAAAADFEHARLPECFAGLARDTFEIPVRYPVACHPQAWAAGAMPYLLTTTLGLRPDGLAGRLFIDRPQLPTYLDRLQVCGVRVGSARVDLGFRRSRDGTDVSVGQVDGSLDVIVEPGKEATP